MVRIGGFWGLKLHDRSNFGVGRKKFFLETVSTIISVRFINITLVKNFINGVNLVKMGHFFENCQYWVILHPKMTQYDVIGQNLGKVVKKFYSKNLETLCYSGLFN